ncbi:phosphoribosylanthranilate isomerase [Reinekea sp.]|uniref:phosphoribosylanthranilate isomerase n=1 Tax=Reinekea sp. TaxID=1970455 RepID=UPI002A7EFD58|nr:phosphoribosylanthranilate isomerase [Reinekea sp.]
MASDYRRTRIKMCGMTRPEDLIKACQLGVDAVGLVFYPPSPRSLSLALAEPLAALTSALTRRVALMVNPDAGYVREVVAATQADMLQFHGDESADFCQQFGKPYIKALRVKNAAEVVGLITQHRAADLILLDAYVPGIPGGTGQTFDWSLVPDTLAAKVMLAGGLNETNVPVAIERIRPYAVDVSGGIETAPGIKSADKMALFVQAVMAADRLVSEISS